MKLKYEGKKTFLILFPENVLVQKGTEIETTDKNFIKDLKGMGFKEVKVKKEDDK